MDALIMMMNREIRDESDRLKAINGSRVIRFDDDEWPVDNLPEEI